MKAGELRLGNYVKGGDTFLHEIIEITKIRIVSQAIKANSTSIFNYPDVPSSILLSEEWLLNFGFEKSFFQDLMRNKTYETFTKGSLKVILEDGLTIPVRVYDNVSLNAFGAGFKQAHQLQNLYFALTGEELISNA